MTTRARRAVLSLALSSFLACTSPSESSSEVRLEGNLEPGCPDVLAGASAKLPVTEGWRAKLVEFAEAEVRHSAWGLAHSKRNFVVSLQLARIESLSVDEDVLFAAALLHDLGGLAGHDQEGVDHAVRSAELAPTILLERGFPREKIDAVKEVILAHPYYTSAAPTSAEATVFHDADLLDFVGAIGIARLVSTTGRDTRDLGQAVALSRQLLSEVPPKLITGSAQCNGKKRVAFLEEIHQSLSAETIGDAFF